MIFTKDRLHKTNLNVLLMLRIFQMYYHSINLSTIMSTYSYDLVIYILLYCPEAAFTRCAFLMTTKTLMIQRKSAFHNSWMYCCWPLYMYPPSHTFHKKKILDQICMRRRYLVWWSILTCNMWSVELFSIIIVPKKIAAFSKVNCL